MSFFRSGVRRGRTAVAAAAVVGLAGLTTLAGLGGPAGVLGVITAQAAVLTYDPCST